MEARFCWNSKDTGCIRRISARRTRFDVALSMGGYESQAVRGLRNPAAGACRECEFNAVLEDGRERYERSFVPLRERAREKAVELETEIVLAIRRSRSFTRRTRCRPASS